MNATEAEVGVEFNKTTPLEKLPENKVVQETLEQAIKTTTFNVAFQPGSVQIISFINRAALLKSNLAPLFQRTFSSLRTFVVIFFSNGSIINNIDLAFSSAFVPTNRQIAEVLVNASSNITAFNIDTSFIFVDGIQMSSGVSHKISLITTFSMVLLAWLLTSQQQR
ncbi:hypothetical protein CRENBAI_013797 [Crenichthys baileyi]|uniref:SEA domain-containing protein n=1 Tax=Crenichthys baileyi TaxID=28760 RepID=A0AAV9S156_9TELE